MIYLTNKQKHYFAISDEAWTSFDSDYLQRSGCEIHNTQKDMYDYLVKEYGYTPDQLEGHDITLSLNDKGEIVESFGVNNQSIIYKDEVGNYNDWLAGFNV